MSTSELPRTARATCDSCIFRRFLPAESITSDLLYYATIFPICQINGEFMCIKNPFFIILNQFLMIHSHLNAIFRRFPTDIATFRQMAQRVIRR